MTRISDATTKIPAYPRFALWNLGFPSQAFSFAALRLYMRFFVLFLCFSRLFAAIPLQSSNPFSYVHSRLVLLSLTDGNACPDIPFSPHSSTTVEVAGIYRDGRDCAGVRDWG